MDDLKAAIDPYFTSFAAWTSIAGTGLSIYLFFITGSIQRQIKAYSAYKRLEADKRAIKQQLEGIIKAVVEDKLWDTAIISDIFKLLGRLGNYNQAFPKDQAKSLLRLETLLRKRMSFEEQNEAIIILSLIAGRLDVKGEYVGG